MTAGTTIITASSHDGSQTANCEVTVNSLTSIEISDVPLARVYPNPTDGTLNLEFEADGVHIVTITDMTGKTLLRKAIAGQNTMQIDVSDYPSGAYLLTIDGKTMRIIRN